METIFLVAQGTDAPEAMDTEQIGKLLSGNTHADELAIWGRCGNALVRLEVREIDVTTDDQFAYHWGALVEQGGWHVLAGLLWDRPVIDARTVRPPNCPTEWLAEAHCTESGA